MHIDMHKTALETFLIAVTINLLKIKDSRVIESLISFRSFKFVFLNSLDLKI